MPIKKRQSRVDWVLSAMALFVAYVGYFQIRNYPLTFLPIPPTDLAGFFQLRFSDGFNHWPYDYYTLSGSDKEVLPIEYPVLIGLIVWLTSFIPIPGMSPKFAYVTVNAFLIGALFIVAINGLSSLTNRRVTKYLLLSPVIVLSLYLNWDLWAITPLIFAIVFYQSEKYLQSAVLLGISIAVKFFPVVLLLPILVYFYRTGHSRLAVKYLLQTFLTWLAINLPVMVISPSGWSRFYLYSLERSLGEGSIFAIPGKLGLEINVSVFVYTLVNLFTFLSLIVFLMRRKLPVRIEEASFLAVAAFTAFGKQYSIQYVLWLTPLAILSIYFLTPKDQKRIFPYFVLWQMGEFFMYYGYFQNMWKVISNVEYAFWASSRYSLFFLFCYKLIALQRSSTGLMNLSRKKK